MSEVEKDHVTVIGRVLALVYTVLFLPDQVVYASTLIVEFLPQISGPISKWKKHFPP
jgi:hypothetical protein